MTDKLQQAAEAQLAQLDSIVQAALKTPKQVIKLLVAVCVLILAVCSVLGWYAVQQNHLSHVVQAGSIASCDEANQARAANVTLWDGLLDQEVQSDNAIIKSAAFASLKTAIDALPASDPDTAAIQQFFNLTYSDTSGPALTKEIQEFKSFIAAHEKQENCEQEYGK